MADEFQEDDYQDHWYGDDVATFGDRLAAARLYARLSQGDLAKRLGVKKSTIVSWEDDLNEPRANKLQMMAGLLNVSIGWLLMGEGEGVGITPDETDIAEPDLAGLMVEMRDIRTQMKNSGDRLALLEKKLRLKVQGMTAE